MGHRVTVFEANSAGGGMIRYGVPEYRMPAEKLDQEIRVIEAQGVEMKYSTLVGTDVSLAELQRTFDAVFISTGLQDAASLRLTGEDLETVWSGVRFLDDVTRGRKVKPGKKVAVIGGGNVAIDAARTARRLGAEVTIYYRRREEDMPADREEIDDARLEGVEIHTQAIPVQIEKNPKGGTVLVWGKARLEDQGPGKRPRPVLILGETFNAEVDTVISAIGQTADLSYITEAGGIDIVSGRNKIAADAAGRTAAAGVFAGGDVVNSAGDAISAIADGYRAARAIDAFLTKKEDRSNEN